MRAPHGFLLLAIAKVEVQSPQTNSVLIEIDINLVDSLALLSISGMLWPLWYRERRLLVRGEWLAAEDELDVEGIKSRPKAVGSTWALKRLASAKMPVRYAGHSMTDPNFSHIYHYREIARQNPPL